MMMLMMMVVAETEVTFDEDPDVVRTTSAVMTSSVDDCNVNTAWQTSNTTGLTSQSELDDRNNDLQWLVICRLAVSRCG